jgi:hypothetical protein
MGKEGVHTHDFDVLPSDEQQTYNQHGTHKHQAGGTKCNGAYEYYVCYVGNSQQAYELSRNLILRHIICSPNS